MRSLRGTSSRTFWMTTISSGSLVCCLKDCYSPRVWWSCNWSEVSSKFHVSPRANNLDQVTRLLFAIRAIYHAPNPYHNYIHAIDVLQATYSFLIALGLAPPFSYIRNLGPNTAPWKRPIEKTMASQGPGSRRARQVFRPQDVFGILLAAMGHDVGHPGLSNAFMVSDFLKST